MIGLVCLAIGQATISHTFVFEAKVPYQTVHVAGTFNSWNKAADPMVLNSGSHQWKLTKNLSLGVHQYKFVLNDTEWITDPKAKSVDDGNGNVNSVLNLLPIDPSTPASRTDSRIIAEGLFHQTKAPHFIFDSGQVRIQIQAIKGDLAGASLNYGSRNLRMNLAKSDEYFDWYRAEFPWQKGNRLAYHFVVSSGGIKKNFGDEGIGIQSKFIILNPEPISVASWPQYSVNYQIFPDRFHNGSTSNDPKGVMPWNGKPTYSNYFGGDAVGVAKKIPYLKEIGVSAIYFNPLFASPSNHRYETSDYKRVDPRFGTNDEFRKLTRLLKESGIRTILDGVFNHSATDFGPFADLTQHGEKSIYKGWYFPKSYPVKVGDPPNYEAWFGFPSMPKLNLENQGAANYMLQIPKFWDKNAEIAGWRLDVANEVSPAFWRRFRNEVKGLGKDRWIIGEIWGDGSPWLLGDQFDSVMGYQFRDATLKFVADQTTRPSQYFDQLMKVHESYAPSISRNLMILLGSHDTPRILNLCKGNKNLAMLAATLQLTWVGSPSIYYGDEIGMEGGVDPENRRGMNWESANSKNPVLRHYKALIAARNRSKALQKGEPTLLMADDARGFLAYQRSHGVESAFVVVNRSAARVIISLSNLPKGSYRNIFDRKLLEMSGGNAIVKLGPRSSAVYLKSGAN